MKKQIYLDYNASTPLAPEVEELILELKDYFANPSASYKEGQKAKKILEDARLGIASLINCTPQNIVFTSGGTESNNSSLFQILTDKNKHRKLLISAIEHASVFEYADFLQNFGITLKIIPVDTKGYLNLDILEEECKASPSFVSVIWANNEISTIQNTERIVQICKDNNSLLHLDAVQVLGKLPIDTKITAADFISFSAHKIYGPRGIGALYIRKPNEFMPLIHGGGQENNHRSGTENPISAKAFAKALEIRTGEMSAENTRLLKLKKLFAEKIEGKIENYKFNGDMKKGLPNTISITFPGVDNTTLLLYLDMENIFVSAGSACSSGSVKASRILTQTGLSEIEAHNTIRISMGKNTTEESINMVSDSLIKIVNKLINY